MNPSVKEWIDLASVDLLAAKNLCNDERLTNVVCFHSQQCVEKSLKAIIEANDEIPPKTHDLIRLYGMVEGQIVLDEDMLAKLNELYIESRYPSTIGLLPNGTPTVEDAKEFYKYATQLHKKIIVQLNQ
jgi:HEPN domain-containing protein